MEKKFLPQAVDVRHSLSREVVNSKKGRTEEANPAITQQLFTDIVKLRKDFAYLKKPSIMPKAYEASIIEMKRRMIFRQGLDE